MLQTHRSSRSHGTPVAHRHAPGLLSWDPLVDWKSPTFPVCCLSAVFLQQWTKLRHLDVMNAKCNLMLLLCFIWFSPLCLLKCNVLEVVISFFLMLSYGKCLEINKIWEYSGSPCSRHHEALWTITPSLEYVWSIGWLQSKWELLHFTIWIKVSRF